MGFFTARSTVCPGLGHHGLICIKIPVAGRGQGGPSSNVPKKSEAFASLYSEFFLKVAETVELSFWSITEKPAGSQTLRKGYVDAKRQIQWYLKTVIKLQKCEMCFK